jgi:hypothetical protein
MENKRASNDDKLRQLIDAVDLMDETVSEQTEYSAALMQMKNDAMVKERDRLVKKYGQDNIVVRAFTERIAYHDTVNPVRKEVINHMKVRTDPPALDGWRVQGQVMDENTKPMPNINVLLIDEKRQPVRDLPTGCSNDDGYYSITVDKDQVKKHQEKLFLAVVSKYKKVEQVDDEEMTASEGAIESRDIILKKETCEPIFDNENPPR